MSRFRAPAFAWKNTRTLRGALCVLLFWPLVGVTAQAAIAKPAVELNVAAVIEAEKLVAVSDGGEEALWSPDRQWVLIKTKRGDISTNETIETFRIYSTRKLAEYMDGHTLSAPHPAIVKEIRSSQEWNQVSNLRWKDSSTVVFIAKGENGKNQGFRLAVGSGEIQQITHSSTDVRSFDFTAERVVYSATVNAPRSSFEALGDRSIAEIGFWNKDDPLLSDFELFSGSIATGEIRKMSASPMRPAYFLNKLWISPKGNYAIAVVPSVNAPSTWSEYKAYSDWWNYRHVSGIRDASSWQLIYHVRYALVDLRTGAVSSLLDAPIGYISFNNTPLEVLWRQDERSVIVTNTFLPLEGVPRNVRERRKRSPATVEIDLSNSSLRSINFEPAASTASSEGTIFRTQWGVNGNEVQQLRRDKTGNTVSTIFSYRHGSWSSLRGGVAKANPIDIGVRQGINERPKVFLRGAACSCAKVLFDPSPQFEDMKFGRAENRQFKDRNGLVWDATLLFPVDYEPGKKYPLVVQTHGWSPNKFLLTGPSDGTAFAARALSSSGMLVLQISDRSGSMDPLVYADGYEDAILSLVDEGIVKRESIALTAFSATGFPAVKLLARSPKLLTAIIIADSVQPAFTVLTLLRFQKNFLKSEIDRIWGGEPSSIGYEKWFKNNPLYNLDEIKTAVRLEAPSVDGLVAMAETYSLLRKANKSVDLIYYPTGEHNLQKPAEQLQSQGGAVDWYRYWLQDYVDLDPRKKDQYRRWAELKAASQKRDGVITK